MDEHTTRTILITDFPKNIAHAHLLRICKTVGAVKEHFVMNNKHSVFFVSFYDLRTTKKAKDVLSGEKNGFTVKYAISQREIPKGSDSCTEDKNQGSVVYMANEAVEPENQEEVIDSIKKGKEHTVRFYNSKEALKFLNSLKTEHPRSQPKIVWDNDLRKRITLLKAAEEIVKAAPAGFFKGVSATEQPMKRQMEQENGPGTETMKRTKMSTNWMLALFDSFITENADRILANLG
ncbi:hypothetical protein NERG_00742 [Nematocida ausubeli]|uniref:RRM domain-containing protein n=1 Tax=Nematocida ausubeli (strain ATCC PRA-371 / ERTm2) TaxID=1913371 RepID=H8ZAZ3_NEMA1|nr:hypothetical protein NERG_00742 [Nematocida ausubeli]